MMSLCDLWHCIVLQWYSMSLLDLKIDIFVMILDRGAMCLKLIRGTV